MIKKDAFQHLQKTHEIVTLINYKVMDYRLLYEKEHDAPSKKTIHYGWILIISMKF